MKRVFAVAVLWGLGLLAGAQGLVLEDDLVQLFELSPGQEAVASLTLRNTGTAPLAVAVEAADYQEGRGFLPLGEVSYSLGADLVLEASRVTLPPGGTAQVRFRLRAPAQLEGTRYAYLLLTPEAPERREEGNVTLRLVQRYAVLVAVSHGGRPEVRFAEAKVAEGRLYVLGENRGNRLYRPLVRVQVLGKEGVVREANLGQYTFLPGDAKRLVLDLPPLAPGEYAALFLLDDGVYAYALRVRLNVR
jgi:hypothetical protein